MDEQVELLRGIWGEMKALNGRVDTLNERVGSIDARVDALNGQVGARLGTALAELSLDVRELTGVVHAWRDEHRIDREDLRERVARLERRVGLEPP